MKSIVSTNGFEFFVDDEDFKNVCRYKWSVESHGRTYRVVRKNCITINEEWIGPSSTKIHRFILKAKKGNIIDHIDGNGLNNCRANLRFCTHAENLRNSPSRLGSTSKYLGVSWDKRSRKWVSQIQVNGKNLKLGRYFHERIAAEVYNDASKKYFGEFARLNQL